MPGRHDRIVATPMAQPIAHGPGAIGEAIAERFNPATRLERGRCPGAGRRGRTPGRRACADGDEAERVDTPAGTVSPDAPKAAGHDGAPFHPQALERGRRSCRAAVLAVAGMSVEGASTRDAAETWPGADAADGPAAFAPPEDQRERPRTATPIGRAVRQGIERRTAAVRASPSRDALLRLGAAVRAAIDGDRLAPDRRYIAREDRDA